MDTGATWRFEAGAKITLNYTQQLTDEFEVTAKSDLFINYLDILTLQALEEFLDDFPGLHLNIKFNTLSLQHPLH